MVVENEKGETIYLSDCVVAYDRNMITGEFVNFRFSKSNYVLTNSYENLENKRFCAYIGNHCFNERSQIILSHKPFKIEYKNYKIYIKRTPRYDEFKRKLTPFIIIRVESELETYENLLSIYQLVLDMITIVLGKTPKYINTQLETESGRHFLYRDLIDKYKNKSETLDYPISNITEETINIETLKRLEELSKTKPKLITAYITQLNCLSYVELSLSGLLQTVEGLYKNTSLINEYGKKRNMGIYQHIYERNSTNLILNKDDRITTVVETNNKEKIEVSQFVRYMVDIRNFYTHYNEKNNSKLVGETFLYIFLKVSIASRIVLFEEILGRTDIRLIGNSVRNIDLYAPYKGLRYDQ